MQTFREKLEGGRPQLGFCAMYPAPGVIERVGPDWDWIWIDGQHGQIGYSEVLGLVRACDLIQRPAFVRVPGHEFGPIGMALDTGAAGVIVPCVDTAEQARAIVGAAKFPPLGGRSYGGRRPIDFQGRTYAHTANTDVLLAVQIETPEAVDNIDAIAAVEGVDLLFLGPDDLLMRRGVRFDEPRPTEMLVREMEPVAEACRRHGKIGVMVAMGAELITICAEMGFGMIVAGGDVPFLANSSKAASASAREALAAAKETPSRNGSTPGKVEAGPTLY